MQKRIKSSSQGKSVQLRSSSGFHSRLELCAAEEAELQQPMAGPGEPGGGAGRSYAPEPLGMRAGGRPGRARPGPARLDGLAAAAGTQEAARLGAGAGHIPRRRRLREIGRAHV